MSDSGAPTRTVRTDAQRNRSHIVAVAERVFLDVGINGPMDAIAKGAGVGAATLYRHFPTRDALLAAVLDHRSDQLALVRPPVDPAADPAATLDQWLTALGVWATTFHGLPDPLRTALDDDDSPLAPTCRRLVTTTHELLVAAQTSGRAWLDITGRDLVLGVLATSWVSRSALADTASPAGLNALVRRGWMTP